MIDSLEFARGVLSFTSFASVDVSREVHITKLSRYFEKAGIASIKTLETLRLLREAERLDGGYWIPVPTRAIPLADGLSLIVSIHPTDELRRHFPSVQRAGQGRIVETTEVSNLPTQSLNYWRQADGHNATDWAKSTINGARDNFAPSVGEDELEVFGTRPRLGAANYWECFWARSGDGNACMWQGVSLFRAQTGQKKYRHFLGQRKGNSVFLEGPPVHEVPRMQYGLAALQGRPLCPELTLGNGVASISLPLAPPVAIRRLLMALCEEDRCSFGRTWYCRISACVPMLYNALKELSDEVLHHE